MSDDDGKRYLFDNKRNVEIVIWGLTAVCVLLFGLDWIVHRHIYNDLENLFGFYAIYGFVACVLLVLLAAEMRKLVMRDENYYGDADEQSTAPAVGRASADEHADDGSTDAESASGAALGASSGAASGDGHV
jgi:hypothetical protein